MRLNRNEGMVQSTSFLIRWAFESSFLQKPEYPSSSNMGYFQEIRDPIHGFIGLTQEEAEIVNT
jgi:hypothetical protein